ncbi:uncharacterized protein IUM83_00453 [Phytophthora cinnamomi]|uniref:uncharacterized protein n=1 Tax=Phytophthora cinnamomi TaxID=4785 RepID=UPI0035599313|nr:hypothetical protein IUM83_00453 [Phytophthora cinnamomi]
MSEDAASSSSSARSHGHSRSPGWPSMHSAERGPRRSVLRTTEKSVVFRVRTEEKLSGGRGRRATSSSTQTLRLAHSGASGEMGDMDVHETLAELYSEAERKKQWLAREEETFQRGQERLSSLRREHDELLDMLKQCKQRSKERVRIQNMLRGPQAGGGGYGSDDGSSASGSSSDSDRSSHRRHSSSRHHHRRRSRKDGTRKERKRLRRFQSDVSLRFQLLQSECRRTDLQVEKAMAELRREYADSCLFGNSLNF